MLCSRCATADAIGEIDEQRLDRRIDADALPRNCPATSQRNQRNHTAFDAHVSLLHKFRCSTGVIEKYPETVRSFFNTPANLPGPHGIATEPGHETRVLPKPGLRMSTTCCAHKLVATRRLQ